MNPFLFLPLGLFLLLALLLCANLKLTVRYRETLGVLLRIGIIKINLLTPLTRKDKKKAKLRKLSASLDRRAPPEKKKKKTAAKEKEPSFEDRLPAIKRILRAVSVQCGKYLKVRLVKIRLVAGGKDAAEIALRYGLYTAAASSLYALLAPLRHFTVCEKNVSVTADFLSEKTAAEIDLRFSVYVWQLVLSALQIMFVSMKPADAKQIE